MHPRLAGSAASPPIRLPSTDWLELWTLTVAGMTLRSQCRQWPRAMPVSAVRVVPQQHRHDRSAFLRGGGVNEEAPDSARLSLGKPGSRRVKPAPEFVFAALVQRVPNNRPGGVHSRGAVGLVSAHSGEWG